MGVNIITDDEQFCEVSPGTVAHLSDFRHRRVFLWPRSGDELLDLDLVRIADVLDEKRLSAMAAHPSNWRRRLTQLGEDPMLGEELA